MGAGRLPLLVTPKEADKLRRQMNRRFLGSGGLTVAATDDAVSISAPAEGRRGGGGGGSVPQLWLCKIVSYSTGLFGAIDSAVMVRTVIDVATGKVDDGETPYEVLVFSYDFDLGSFARLRLSGIETTLASVFKQGQIIPAAVASDGRLWCPFAVELYGCEPVESEPL